MIELRPFSSLGHAGDGLFYRRRHFSFADDMDPKRMGWGLLRVWNDDTIQPHAAFPPRDHHGMEIITYVRRGAGIHLDIGGEETRVEAGDVHVMSPGAGALRSISNRGDEAAEIFVIGISSNVRGGAPGGGVRSFPRSGHVGRFVALASGEPDDGEAIVIRSNARLLASALKRGVAVSYLLAPDRHAYLVPASGLVRIGGTEIKARDGAAVTGVRVIEITALEDSDLVLVDTA